MSHPPIPKDIAQARTRERARALADAVVDAFTGKLKTEIDKHGFLGMRHVDAIEADLQAKARQLTTLFAQALDDAAREQEELRWHAIKRPAFDRLMVKRFEDLFFHKAPDGRMHGLLSRRMLPGFFLALNMMLGPETLEQFHRRADARVERIMAGEIPVDWNRVDADAEIRDLILDAQYAIALYFEDTQRRFEWFMHIVNSHLTEPPHPDAPDAHWEMGYRAMHILALSLLADLKAAVQDDAAWARFRERHPDADRQRVHLILERVD